MDENKAQPILRYQKTLYSDNKICIPLNIVKCWGKEYYFDVYDGYIVLTPIKKPEVKEEE